MDRRYSIFLALLFVTFDQEVGEKRLLAHNFSKLIDEIITQEIFELEVIHP